jgi:Heterokaryon incompatibility protein (HET)
VRHGIWHRLPAEEVEKFRLIRKWLGEQVTGREFDFKPQQLARRLIDVGGEGMEPTSHIRVIETAGLDTQNLRYVALSYRWGSQNNLKTTKSTLEDHQKGIPLEKLPKTLFDAVIVTRRLGVRYLWVDSLCIIQDDTGDWAAEAAKMGDVYMNSYFTIAAHASDHADDGFLEQSLQRARAIPVGGSRNGGMYDEETAAYAAWQEREQAREPEKESNQANNLYTITSNAFFVMDGFNSQSYLEHSELSTRGWVLQERILSQKPIHFCKNGVIYFEKGDFLQAYRG